MFYDRELGVVAKQDKKTGTLIEESDIRRHNHNRFYYSRERSIGASQKTRCSIFIKNIRNDPQLLAT